MTTMEGAPGNVEARIRNASRQLPAASVETSSGSDGSDECARSARKAATDSTGEAPLVAVKNAYGTSDWLQNSWTRRDFPTCRLPRIATAVPEPDAATRSSRFLRRESSDVRQRTRKTSSPSSCGDHLRRRILLDVTGTAGLSRHSSRPGERCSWAMTGTTHPRREHTPRVFTGGTGLFTTSLT
jgi:hypothetical protein